MLVSETRRKAVWTYSLNPAITKTEMPRNIYSGMMETPIGHLSPLRGDISPYYGTYRQVEILW